MKKFLQGFQLSFLLCFVFGILTACGPRPTVVPTVDSAVQAQATATLPVKAPQATSTLAVPTATVALVTQTAPSESPAEMVSREIVLDPALAQDADSQKINTYLYEGLLRKGPDGKVEPALAESWVISEDQLDYIFKLRTNGRFSDGTRVTADIVEANFNRWFDPKNPLHGTGNFAAWERYFLGFLGEKEPDKRAKSSFDGVQKVDQLTILIHLNRPVPELLDSLTDPAFGILSIDALKAGSYGSSQSPVVSSGPYFVESWTDTILTLAPNSYYWATVPQDSLVFGLK